MCRWLFLLTLLLASPASAETFPPRSGQIEVVCDGSDATEALREAHYTTGQRGGTHQLSPGVCMIHDDIKWQDRPPVDGSLPGRWHRSIHTTGHGMGKTIVRLADNSPGFQDPNNPKAIFYTASRFDCWDKCKNNPAPGCASSCGEKDAWRFTGSGNKGPQIDITDLTIDCGKGNPGCVCIDFIGANFASLLNVQCLADIHTPAYTAIRMEREYPGPAVIRNLYVKGYKYGARVGTLGNSITFDGMYTSSIGVASIYNRSNALAVRRLSTSGSAPGLINDDGHGHVTIVDSTFKGVSTQPGIINKGHLYVRNVKAPLFASVVQGVPGVEVVEYSSRTGSAFPGETKGLGIPFKEVPGMYWSADPNEIAWINDEGAIPGDGKDDTAAINRTLAKCKPIVLARRGGYHYTPDSLIDIPGCIRTFHGMGSSLHPLGDFKKAEKDIFWIRFSGNSKPLVFAKWWMSGNGNNTLNPYRFIGIDAKARAVVFRDGVYGPIQARSKTEVYVENIVTGPLQLFPGSRVWARQLNIEYDEKLVTEFIRNDGGTLLVLGYKTEKPARLSHTFGGGKTEIIGGLGYPVRDVPVGVPMHEVTDACGAFSMAITAYGTFPNSRWKTLVRENRTGVDGALNETRDLLATAMPRRGNGSALPLGLTRGLCPLE